MLLKREIEAEYKVARSKIISFDKKLRCLHPDASDTEAVYQLRDITIEIQDCSEFLLEVNSLFLGFPFFCLLLWHRLKYFLWTWYYKRKGYGV